MKLFVAGDVILIEPWSRDEDPGLEKLLALAREADAAVCNLEVPLCGASGQPAAESGGIHLAAEGRLAEELAGAGFGLVAHANNHAFDYGSDGLQASLEALHAAGVRVAGAGQDLDEARAPTMIETPAGSLALVSMTTCLSHDARAVDSERRIHGRPGVNPLEIRPRAFFERLESARCRLQDRLGGALSWWNGVPIVRPSSDDVAGNLRSIERAAREADHVAVSVHTHVRGPWRRRFANAAIRAGADVVFMQGRHYVQGVELYRRRPIFYGLNSFVFDIDRLQRVADATYRQFGLDPADGPRRMQEARSKALAAYNADPSKWRSLAAVVELTAEGAKQVTLIPVDIAGDGTTITRGRPRWAKDSAVIAEVARLSKRYGTTVTIDESSNTGRVG